MPYIRIVFLSQLGYLLDYLSVYIFLFSTFHVSDFHISLSSYIIEIYFHLKKNVCNFVLLKVIFFHTETLLNDTQINHARATATNPPLPSSFVTDSDVARIRGGEDAAATSGLLRSGTMTKESDIPTIFNPRRNRTPSVLVTEEGVANGPFAHADSVSSSQQEGTGAEQQQQVPPSGVAGKLKSCSGSICSKSAKKVSIILFFFYI